MPRRKRLFFIATSPVLSGAEKCLFLLLKQIQRDYDCFVIVLQSPSLYDDLFSRCQSENIPIFSLHINTRWQFWKLFRLGKMIRQYQPDILISILFFDSIVAFLFGFLYRLPIIVGIQNADTRQSHWRTWVEKIISRRAMVMFSNSQAGKLLFSHNTGFPLEKIYLVRNVFDPHELQKTQPIIVRNIQEWNQEHTGLRIINVARLESAKDHMSLIQAVEQLHQQGVEVSLVIFGSGSLHHSLEAYIQKNNLSSYIRLWGYVENAQAYIQYFDLFVLSSLYEGLPNVLIEAMAQGVLWCSTDVGSVRDLCHGFEEYCLIFQSQCPQAIQSTILQLQNLPDEVRQHMRDVMQKKALHDFSPQSVADQFRKVIHSLSL